MKNTPAKRLRDELEEHLHGDSELSRAYRKEASPMPPHALDRRIVDRSRGEQTASSPCLAPLALAASILLSVALVLAMVFGPQKARHLEEAPRLLRVAARDAAPGVPLAARLELYSSDPQSARPVRQWLAEIADLRRAGREREAAAELRRFRRAYPNYPVDGATQP